MDSAKLSPMEYRFMEIIWESAPLSAGRLAAFAEARLDWKRTTSYTVLKRLTDRGLILKEGKTVSPLLTKTEADEAELNDLCQKCYGGDFEAMQKAVRNLIARSAQPKNQN